MGRGCVNVPPDIEVHIKNPEDALTELMNIYVMQKYKPERNSERNSGLFDSKVFFHEFAKLGADLQERQIAQIRNYPDDPERWIDITGEGDFKRFLELYAKKFAASVYKYIVRTKKEEDFFATRENSSSVPLLELCKKIILAAMLVNLIRAGDKVRTGGRSLAGPGVGGKDLDDLGLRPVAEMFASLPLSKPFNAKNFSRNVGSATEPRGAAGAKFPPIGDRPLYATFGPYFTSVNPRGP